MQTIDIPAIERELNKSTAPRTITVNVTREDIANAVMTSCDRCAVGLAMRRALAENNIPYVECGVGTKDYHVFRTWNNAKQGVVPQFVTDNIKKLIRAQYTWKARLFGRARARVWAVKPFSFELDV